MSQVGALTPTGRGGDRVWSHHTDHLGSICQWYLVADPIAVGKTSLHYNHEKSPHRLECGWSHQSRRVRGRKAALTAEGDLDGTSHNMSTRAQHAHHTRAGPAVKSTPSSASPCGPSSPRAAHERIESRTLREDLIAGLTVAYPTSWKQGVNPSKDWTEPSLVSTDERAIAPELNATTLDSHDMIAANPNKPGVGLTTDSSMWYSRLCEVRGGISIEDRLQTPGVCERSLTACSYQYQLFKTHTGYQQETA